MTGLTAGRLNDVLIEDMPPTGARGPGFDAPVVPGGYLWWYLDVLDPVSGLGLTIIAFVGNVFSPRYFAARARGAADPHDFCAINVALYRPGGDRWVMSEVARADAHRSAADFSVGCSHLRWEGEVLVVDFDERTAPWPGRLAGQVRLHPAQAFGPRVNLSPDGAHRWYPVAPLAHAEVILEAPQLRFAGPAYHDVNHGDAPLEQHFCSWDWSRTTHADAATVLYDTQLRTGDALRFGRRFTADGQMIDVDPPKAHDLGRTGWRMPRHTRTAPDTPVAVQRTLVDAPFYSRSWLTVGPDHTIHESVDLDRFSAGWVRFLLPFKMRGGFR